MKPFFPLGHWLLELFNPPPRDLLTFPQKISRVFIVTFTLLTACVVAALGTGVMLFLYERLQSGHVGSLVLLKVVAVLLDSLMVNAACLFVLLQVKRIDETLIPRDPAPTEPKP